MEREKRIPKKNVHADFIYGLKNIKNTLTLEEKPTVPKNSVTVSTEKRNTKNTLIPITQDIAASMQEKNIQILSVSLGEKSLTNSLVTLDNKNSPNSFKSPEAKIINSLVLCSKNGSKIPPVSPPRNIFDAISNDLQKNTCRELMPVLTAKRKAKSPAVLPLPAKRQPKSVEAVLVPQIPQPVVSLEKTSVVKKTIPPTKPKRVVTKLVKRKLTSQFKKSIQKAVKSKKSPLKVPKARLKLKGKVLSPIKAPRKNSIKANVVSIPQKNLTPTKNSQKVKLPISPMGRPRLFYMTDNEYQEMVDTPETLFPDDNKDGKETTLGQKTVFYSERLVTWYKTCVKFYKEKLGMDKSLNVITESVSGCQRLRLERDGELWLNLEARCLKSLVLVRSPHLKTWEKDDWPQLLKLVNSNSTEKEKKPEKLEKSDKSPAKKAGRLSLKGSKIAKVSNVHKAVPVSGKGASKETTSTTNGKDAVQTKTGPDPCVASLHNLGNTCFLNSVIQVLRHTPGFVEKVASLSAEIKITQEDREILHTVSEEMDEEQEDILTWTLVNNLQEVFEKMTEIEANYEKGDTNFLAIRPYDLMDTIEQLNPMFEGNLQHDAHELLRCVQAYVQDAAIEINKFRKNNGRKEQVVVKQESTDGDFEEVSAATVCLDDGLIPQGGRPTVKTEALLDAVTPKQKVPSSLNEKDQVMHATTADSVMNRVVNGMCSDMDAVVGATCKLSPSPVPLISESVAVVNGIKSESHDAEIANVKENGPLVTNEVTNLENGRSLKRTSSGTELSRSDRRSRSSTETVFLNGTQPEPRSKRRRGGSLDNGVAVEKEAECMELKPLSLGGKKTKRYGVNGGALLAIGNGDGPVKDTELPSSENSEPIKRCSTSAASGDMKPTPKSDKMVNGTIPVLNGNMSKVGVNGPTEVTQNTILNVKSTSRKTLGIRRRVVANQRQIDNFFTKAEPKTEESWLKRNLGPHVCPAEPDRDLEDEPYSEVEKLFLDLSNSDDSQESLNDIARLKEEAVKNMATTKVTLGSSKSEVTAYLQQNGGDCCSSPMSLRGTEPVNDVIETLFQGGMALRTRCLECENFTERREDYQDLSVPVRKERTEDDDDEDEEEEDIDGDPTRWMLAAFEEVERLVGDNRYFCDECLRLVEAERSMHYVTTPMVLTLHLKRFAAISGLMGGVQKINDHISTPFSLPCISDKCKKQLCQDPQHKFELFALISHTGISISSGHYIAYIRIKSNLCVRGHEKRITQISATTDKTVKNKEQTKTCTVKTVEKSKTDTTGRKDVNKLKLIKKQPKGEGSGLTLQQVLRRRKKGNGRTIIYFVIKEDSRLYCSGCNGVSYTRRQTWLQHVQSVHYGCDWPDNGKEFDMWLKKHPEELSTETDGEGFGEREDTKSTGGKLFGAIKSDKDKSMEISMECESTEQVEKGVNVVSHGQAVTLNERSVSSSPLSGSVCESSLNSGSADPNNNADSNNNLEPNNNLQLNMNVVEKRPTTQALVGSAVPPVSTGMKGAEGANDYSWIECDDDAVQVLTEEAFKELLSPSGTCTPYLLFYKRVTLDT